MRLHIGCGKKYLEGFTNTDVQAIPGARAPDVLCDAASLPFADGSADELMAIHVFEHFFIFEARKRVLPEWRRVLKPGGKLVLEMPDVVKSAKNLIAGMGDQWSMWGLYGNQTLEDPYMAHRWGWCFKTIKPELENAGFVSVVERKPQWHGGRENRDFRVEAFKA